MISERRDCRGKKRTTVLHGGVYQSRNKMKSKKKTHIAVPLAFAGSVATSYAITTIAAKRSIFTAY